MTTTWFQILNGTELNDDKGNYEWKYACGLYIEHSLPSWQINRKMTMSRLGKPRMSMLGNNRQSAIGGQRQQNVTWLWHSGEVLHFQNAVLWEFCFKNLVHFDHTHSSPTPSYIQPHSQPTQHCVCSFLLLCLFVLHPLSPICATNVLVDVRPFPET